MEMIKQYRKKYKITQEDFAKMVGISGPYLCQIEKGIRKGSPELLIDLHIISNGEINFFKLCPWAKRVLSLTNS